MDTNLCLLIFGLAFLIFCGWALNGIFSTDFQSLKKRGDELLNQENQPNPDDNIIWNDTIAKEYDKVFIMGFTNDKMLADDFAERLGVRTFYDLMAWYKNNAIKNIKFGFMTRQQNNRIIAHNISFHKQFNDDGSFRGVNFIFTSKSVNDDKWFLDGKMKFRMTSDNEFKAKFKNNETGEKRSFAVGLNESIMWNDRAPCYERLVKEVLKGSFIFRTFVLTTLPMVRDFNKNEMSDEQNSDN